MLKTSIKICTVLFLCFQSLLSQNDNLAKETYINGKRLCMEQEWDEAIVEFEKIITQYPKSRYVDDAFFWVGYCLEKLPDMQSEAFMQFDYVINKFPNSPWTDDAIVHQITLAELFYLEGKKQYKSFLKKHLNSENNEIRNRAALALGRLNDKSALPVLEKLKDDKDFGMIATNIISLLTNSDSTMTKQSETTHSKKTLNLLYQTERAQKAIEEDEDDIFSFLNSQRYEQYKSMLRKDNDWSMEELQDFALWHILETDEFQGYFVLSNEYDKKEWLRKFWRKNDPTPTTKVNELKEEFDRRVTYARSHFSAFWNYNKMKYLPDQHLRLGWDHAPWDARGELYIKYGEPDVRSVEGWHTEEWIYYKYGVDFLVKQYMTNIYGNAINGGEMSRRRYGDDFLRRMENSWLPQLQTDFIFNNEMRFTYNYNGDPIDNLEMNIKAIDSGLIIEYIVPSEEFSADKMISYNEEIVIYNNDQREVMRKSFQRQIKNVNENIIQKSEFNLPIGEYNLAIKIKDDNSNKMGIYLAEFQVKEK